MGPTITTKTSSAATTAITYDHDANVTITTYSIYSLLLTGYVWSFLLFEWEGQSIV